MSAPELIRWFSDNNGFAQGTKAPHKWVLQAEQELRLQCLHIEELQRKLTPEALAASPEVAALVAEAVARERERCAAAAYGCGYDIPNIMTYDEAQMFRTGAEAARDAIAAAIRSGP